MQDAFPPNPDTGLAGATTVHELHVYQIELAQQNEELLATRAELELSLARHRHLFETAPVGLLTLDRSGRVVELNRRARQLLGARVSAGDWLPGAVHGNDRLRLERVTRSGEAARIDVSLAEDGRGNPPILDIEVCSHDSGPDGVLLALTDVTEQRAAEAMRLAQAQAEAASRAKSDFLANVSHEIRTPMNAILGFAALARETGLDERQRGYLERVESGTRSLLSVLDDILDFAKIEVGRLELEAAAFDPTAVITDVGELFAGQAARRGITLAVQVDPDMPERLLGDPLRVRQILMNLTSNAVKFTERGSVCLRAAYRATAPGDHRLIVEVEDTGIGIAPEVQRRILAPFSQADSSTTRRYGGTGLGLAISRRLVEMMGGSIDFDSVPGEGSRFGFTVPLTVV